MIENKYEILRKKYKPDVIKLLFIAESPPFSKDLRFFYNPKGSQRFDGLFKYTMEVIFNHVNVEKKEFYLQEFKNKGFYLIDAVDFPINKMTDGEKENVIKSNVHSKISEIENLIEKNTPIILIKKNIYQIFYPELIKKGFYVVNRDFIPFPAYNHINRFKKLLKEYLDSLNFNF